MEPRKNKSSPQHQGKGVRKRSSSEMRRAYVDVIAMNAERRSKKLRAEENEANGAELSEEEQKKKEMKRERILSDMEYVKMERKKDLIGIAVKVENLSKAVDDFIKGEEKRKPRIREDKVKE